MMPSRRRFLHGCLGAALSACIPEGRFKRPLQFEPTELDDGLHVATPEQVGLDPDRLRRVYEHVFSEDRFPNALSLLVLRDGRLVGEGYVREASDLSRKEHVQSVTKSLTSLAFGVARGLGHFPDLDEPLSEILHVRDRRKRTITLRHLLTMRSGIAIDNTQFATKLLIPQRRHMTQYLLDQPLAFEPGERFDYRDCDPQLLGAAIAARSGVTVRQLLERHVFAPLGIEDLHWQHNADGEPLCAHGVWLRARDLAKLAELVRREGQWEQPLVPADWIAEATRRQSTTHRSDADYGYYFWTVPELAGHTTWGHGGNFSLIVPEARLVLVLTSMPYAGGPIAADLQDVVSLARELI